MGRFGFDTLQKGPEGWIEPEGPGIGEVITVAEDSLATDVRRAEFLAYGAHARKRIEVVEGRQFSLQCMEKLPHGSRLSNFTFPVHPGRVTGGRQSPRRPEPLNATEAEREWDRGRIWEEREGSEDDEAGALFLNISRQLKNRLAIAQPGRSRLKWAMNKRSNDNTITGHQSGLKIPRPGASMGLAKPVFFFILPAARPGREVGRKASTTGKK